MSKNTERPFACVRNCRHMERNRAGELVCTDFHVELPYLDEEKQIPMRHYACNADASYARENHE